VATFGYLCLISLSFTAIVHTLNATLGKVGQFLGLVLLVLQLASAGGTFPWQTIPDPLYPVHYLLPMSYAVDGLRHLLYGGTLDTLSLDAGVLVLWIAVAVLLAAVAARRQRVWTPSRVQPELAL
jgi:putative membrane protein